MGTAERACDRCATELDAKWWEGCPGTDGPLCEKCHSLFYPEQGTRHETRKGIDMVVHQDRVPAAPLPGIPPEPEGPAAVGLKFDTGKPPLNLIPPEFLYAAARAFGFGAPKYGERNWELGGIGYERLFGAVMRHLWAYHGGELKDPESGLSHLDHATAALAMLVATVERGGR